MWREWCAAKSVSGVEVGIFDHRSFSRCGDEESLVGRDEGNRSQRPCLQAVVALKRGSKLHRVVRAERVALKQIAEVEEHRFVRYVVAAEFLRMNAVKRFLGPRIRKYVPLQAIYALLRASDRRGASR